MQYDYDLQCYINAAGIVEPCGHPDKVPGCAGCHYAGMSKIDARAAAGIDAITAGDIATQKAKPAAEAAFDAAVNCGVLSADHTAHNYAGDYMYMGHDPESNLAQFKHSITREYIAYEPLT